jgi:hypothetical protein
MPRRLIAAFNAGEISPLLDARLDIEKYQNAARIMENCVPKIYGGAFGRAGLEWMGPVKDHGRKVRLIEFIFSATTNFVLEFGHLYVRFWSNGVQIPTPGNPAVPLEIASPYTEEDLFSIQYAQANDVMYLVDGHQPAQKLTRLADDSWTLTTVPWKYPALLVENVTATTLACSATTGTGLTLTASTALFNAGHVGGYFQIAHRRSGAFTELALTATATGSEIRILGKYDVFTYGTWNGTLNLERKNELGVWEVVRTWSSKNDRNVQVSGEQLDEAALRFNYTETAAEGSSPPRAVLEAADSRIYGLVKVTGYTSATQVTVDVVQTLHATTAVTTWTEGAWSDYQGHPRTVAIHEQRVIFAGTDKQPLTIWGSLLGDFENFRRSTLADGAFAHVLGSSRGNSIVWLASMSELLVGTQGDEWVVRGSDEFPISATTVSIKRQSGYGSAYMGALICNDAVMFVQRGRLRLREFVYQFERDGYTAPDLTLLAEHITAGGVVQMAFATNPDPVVWVVTGTGQLLSMTFERDQSVVGWSRHITDGQVESVAVIYSAPGQADEIWAVVRRHIVDASGVAQTRRYIERLDPAKWSKIEAGDMAHMIYVDAAKVITLDPPASVVTGLEHLERRNVTVLADGRVHPIRTVNDGTLYLERPASTVVVGLPYTVRLQPTKTDVPLPDGSAQGRKWKTNRATVRLHKTLGGEYADAPDREFYEMINRTVDTPLNAQQPLFSGDRELLMKSTHRGGLDITLRQRLPLPFHVLAIVPEFDISGA